MEVNSEQGGEVSWIVDQEGEAEAMESLCPKVSSLEKLRVLEEIRTLKISEGESENGLGIDSPVTKDQDYMATVESMELSPASDQTEDEDLAMGCKTPEEGIFDPFAPGPEELVVAPKKKILKETKISLRRRLNFDMFSDSMATIESDAGEDGMGEENLIRRLNFDMFSDSMATIESGAGEDGMGEENLIESFSKSFLELILSSQLEEMSVKNTLANSSPAKGFKTPSNLPLLNGIAETCPPAPRRPTLKLRKLSDSICRKLEFGELMARNC